MWKSTKRGKICQFILWKQPFHIAGGQINLKEKEEGHTNLPKWFYFQVQKKRYFFINLQEEEGGHKMIRFLSSPANTQITIREALELLRKATKQWFRSVCWEIWGKITKLLFTSHWRPNTHKINFPVTIDEYDTPSLNIYFLLYRWISYIITELSLHCKYKYDTQPSHFLISPFVASLSHK